MIFRITLTATLPELKDTLPRIWFKIERESSMTFVTMSPAGAAVVIMKVTTILSQFQSNHTTLTVPV